MLTAPVTRERSGVATAFFGDAAFLGDGLRLGEAAFLGEALRFGEAAFFGDFFAATAFLGEARFTGDDRLGDDFLPAIAIFCVCCVDLAPVPLVLLLWVLLWLF